MKHLSKLGLFNFLIILSGVLGTIFICFSDYFLWYDIAAADKINATVLWLTAVAIFWYTKATYDLKRLARDDLDMAREAQRREFLPILVPVEGKAIVEDGRLKLPVLNEGKAWPEKLRSGYTE